MSGAKSTAFSTAKLLIPLASHTNSTAKSLIPLNPRVTRARTRATKNKTPHTYVRRSRAINLPVEPVEMSGIKVLSGGFCRGKGRDTRGKHPND
jgi:hypothetical protein